MLVQYMLSSSVCLPVHLPSVTCQYCVKMAKPKIMQMTPHDTQGTPDVKDLGEI